MAIGELNGCVGGSSVRSSEKFSGFPMAIGNILEVSVNFREAPNAAHKRRKWQLADENKVGQGKKGVQSVFNSKKSRRVSSQFKILKECNSSHAAHNIRENFR